MPFRLYSSTRNSRGGVALVIVLAFLVLLTAVVLAFFSRATSERVVSNSSATQTKADVFALGAADAIIADLKQEIADPNRSIVTSPAAGVTIYTPKAPANAVPALVGSTGRSGLQNLIKISTHVQASSGGTIVAANVASTTSSQNGRMVTLARWNKPLFVQTTSLTDLTPAASTAFPTPDWVVVTRDGTNATVAGPTVAGRYAYAIYDEGGLLDANVAAYPVGAPPGSPPLYNSGNSDLKAAYKNALAFADLSQLPGLAALSLTRQQGVINSLVGWRNIASTRPTLPSDSSKPGSLTPGANGFDFTTGVPTGLLRFTSAILTNTSGFLKTTNSSLFFSQTDRMLSSRQQLIALMMQGIATGGSTAPSIAERTNIQTSLQYLGTFSRGLNQPSFAPDPDRPPTQAGTGGNDFGTGSLTDPATGDNLINPSFLTLRVAAPFQRFDSSAVSGFGANADVGQPLVKKRFALNRLAWLTYKGPSANNMSDPSVQATITALGGNPLSPTDPVYVFVNQGTAQNIYNYFGLSWISDPVHSGASEWVYSHTGTAPVSSVPGSPATINKLAALTAREADFFELLRASVTLGSLGKAYTAETGTSVNGYQQTRIYCTARDQSVDAAIIQMGANLIDQFDYDGYPSRILVNTGLQGVPFKEYRGVEDLPYLNRVREARIRTQDSAPAAYTSLPVLNQTLTTAGKCVVLQQPEVWNPHAWSGNDSNAGSRPTSFRIIALNCNPSHASDIINSGDANLTSNIKLNVYWRPALAAGGNRPSPPASAQPAQPLTQDNSELLFEMPANGTFLYREPTILMKPGVPTLSNLRIGTNAANFVKVLSGAAYFTSVDAAFGIPYFNFPAGITDNKQYIGVVPGGEVFPLSWQGTINANYIAPGNPVANTAGIMHAQYAGVTSGDSITYRLQYNDSGRWLTYDEKYAPLLITNNYDSWDNSSSVQTYPFRMPIGGYDATADSFDPRTNRFGMHLLGRDGRSGIIWLPPGVSATKADAAQAMTTTSRSSETSIGQEWITTAAGVANSAYNCGASALGWYPPNANPNPPMASGMFAQNNPSALSAGASGNRFCYADPDGVVRRALGAYPQPTLTQPAPTPPPTTASGIPTKKAYATTYTPSLPNPYTFSPLASFSISSSGEDASRPIMLNRPFRSVAELGYTFSGIPWKNLDFFTPESGSAALLDVFCVNDSGDTTSMVAGKVNLNTRQAPVLQAILAGAYKNEFSPATSIGATGSASATTIASGLVIRTSDTTASLGTGSGPVKNIADIVGKWVGGGTAISGTTAPFNMDGSLNYSGFSGLSATTSPPAANPPNLSDILSSDTYTYKIAKRFREATLRALANTGQTRVWNLMIDVVAQTGRYPASATTAADLPKFVVEGEQRYWVHLAIDRLTGQVIDKQIEVVKE